MAPILLLGMGGTPVSVAIEGGAGLGGVAAIEYRRSVRRELRA